jgi:hypothetical protein
MTKFIHIHFIHLESNHPNWEKIHSSKNQTFIYLHFILIKGKKEIKKYLLIVKQNSIHPFRDLEKVQKNSPCGGGNFGILSL